MLAGYGLVVAADTFSLVWAGSVSGAERRGGCLHGWLVLVVLAFMAGA